MRVEEDDKTILRQNSITTKAMELSSEPLCEDQIIHRWLTFRFARLVRICTRLYVMHGWYDVIAYLDSDNKRKLACWLGPAEDYGGGEAALLLPKAACLIIRSTFWALTTMSELIERMRLRKC